MTLGSRFARVSRALRWWKRADDVGELVKPREAVAADGTRGWQTPPHPTSASSPPSVLGSFAGMPPQAAIAHLQTSPLGLTVEEASNRLLVAGRNVLSTKKPMPWWRLLLSVLPNPFNILLAAIAVVSVANPKPNWSTFAILAVMIAVSSAVRFHQEFRSNVAAARLAASVTNDVRVRRRQPSEGSMTSGDGDAGGEKIMVRETIVDFEELVPGDILLLGPGDSIPADCLVIQASFLHVSQASLTGESHSVKKSASPSSSEGKDELDMLGLENIVFMGTSVVSGSGIALVLRTGDDTVVASITKALNKKSPINAFQRGIRNVSYMLIGFMCVMVPIVLAVSGKVTHDWKGAALFSVSVAVGLVPEMLPAIVNANLARGAFMLAKKKAIVKRLDAIQNLGAMSVLCSDKTGTLTNDNISLGGFVSCEGLPDPRILHLAYTNAVYQTGANYAIDAAILSSPALTDAEKAAITVAVEKVAEIPFTFEKRRSSCIVKHADSGQLELICKGAFEETLAICTQVRSSNDGTTTPLDPPQRAALTHRVVQLNQEGYRVLLVATRELAAYNPETADSDEEEGALSVSPLISIESNLTAQGLLTFLDPPKPGAAAAIERLQALGVQIRLLTGDTLGVSLQLCRTLNLVTAEEGGVDEARIQAVSGPDLARLEEGSEEFDELVSSCRVFAKLTPLQKGQVVMSLKKSGHCVGMLGDGVNDSIALKLADVGISVDSGAGAAKDVVEIILTEKDLTNIVDCVTAGRLTHGNTIKYIKMVASSNFGNVFSILAASAWLPFEPMTGLQILVQNLLYDISQIAICWDRVDEDYLMVPRGWDSKELLRFVLVFGPLSSTIDMCTFCLGWFYYGIKTIADPELVKRFQTHWFLEGLLTQTLIVHLLRTSRIPVLQSRAAPILVFSTVTIMAIGLVIPFIPPLARGLGMARPAPSFLGFLALELLVYCLEVQAVKAVYKRVTGGWL